MSLSKKKTKKLKKERKKELGSEKVTSSELQKNKGEMRIFAPRLVQAKFMISKQVQIPAKL